MKTIKKVRSSASPQDLAFIEDFLFHQSYWGIQRKEYVQCNVKK